MREAGSEGIELVMWLIARGAMADASGGAKPNVAHRFYHVPASNTAVGHLVLEEQREIMTINVALAGAGAFGIKHLDAIKAIDGVKVISLMSRDLAKTKEVAVKYGIPHVTTDLADSLGSKEVDAVILCTPTPLHASQALACLGGRQARSGRDSSLRFVAGTDKRSRRPRWRERQGGDVRPHAPFQPEPPVGAPVDPEG